MSKLTVTIGASSSGKSGWAETVVKSNPEVININRDDIRFSLTNGGIRDWSKYKFNKTNENRVTAICDSILEDALEDRRDIIISDTNLNPKYRDKYRDIAEKAGYVYEEKVFHCEWEELVRRNANRVGGLSESLLWDQYVRFERQFGNIKVYGGYNPELEDTIICDIDGTIASMDGIRKPFEWNKVGLDKPRTDIIKMVEALGESTRHVTFLSGRDGVCYDATYRWITENVNTSEFYWDLWMRKEGDSRKDSVIKDILYERYIRDIHNVRAVIDDRRQMIRHWTLKGLPNIIDVGNYNDEF